MTGGRRHRSNPIRLSPGDIMRDAARTIRSRPGRTVGLGLAVALGVATFVGVLSMSDAADRQVQRRIAAARPELVKLRPNVPSDGLFDDFGADVVERVDGTAGVRQSVVVHTYTDRAFRVRLGSDGEQVETGPVMGVEGDFVEATRSDTEGQGLDATTTAGRAHVAVVGGALADRIGLADPTTRPTIWVEGVPFMVIGLVTDSRYLSGAVDGVIIPRRTAIATLGEEVFDSTAYVRTERGSADTAAVALPLRLTPQAPERWAAEVPRVPIDVAEGISADLRNLSLAMAALVLFIGAVAIGNAMMRSVFERTPEIGLRRALGARSRHVLSLLVVEAALIGTVAGILGVVIGVVASLAVAGHNHWPITVSDWAVAVSVPGAMAVGALGGLPPAITAIRITPSQALRRE